MVFEACDVFGSMSGKWEAPPLVRAIFWKHLHAGMQLALQKKH